ncbi:DUF5681 domain-containing protein [uncultured Enterovirga sp.]|uniref:DUF5681 domain-containing protein n=1 Tax=uncultured Enterovirga sp. TaxID=2026352 RepID=UPI0035CAA810
MSADGPPDDEPADYKVGYKRPPLHSRFKPGVSANPRGRPKGRRNLKHDLEEELSERLTLRDGDRQLRLTKQRALVKATIARAIKGDARAQAQAYTLLLRAFGMDDEVRDKTDLASADADILANYLSRINKGRSS